MAPLNPLVGVTVMLKSADLPWPALCEGGAITTLKSGLPPPPPPPTLRDDTHFFSALLQVVCTRKPCISALASPAQMSAFSPLFGSYQPSGGPSTVARPTSASVQ